MEQDRLDRANGTVGHRTRVKICGITREADLQAAVRAGADAVGLVFYPRSPRHVTPDRAARLTALLPPFVSAVGLFVNSDRAFIERTVARCRLDVIQLHGDETPEMCQGLPRPVLKAMRVAGARDLEGLDRYPVQGLLLDAKRIGHYGGTGHRFDWSLLEGFRSPRPLLLAGGLNGDNVAEAIQRVRPHAVDVSSGVESAPGIKDEGRIDHFMQRVRWSDDTRSEV